jgi:hypothetical protein
VKPRPRRCWPPCSTPHASLVDLVAEIPIGGGAHPLSEFHPRETRAGVSAAPWATRRVFPHTFMTPSTGERVWVREGPSRLPIRGNVTGITSLNTEVASKRLELLHEVVPKASTIGLLVNQANPQLAHVNIADMQAASRSLALQILILNASSNDEIDEAFAALAGQAPQSETRDQAASRS